VVRTLLPDLPLLDRYGDFSSSASLCEIAQGLWHFAQRNDLSMVGVTLPASMSSLRTSMSSWFSELTSAINF
jgi:hypothetical protein